MWGDADLPADKKPGQSWGNSDIPGGVTPARAAANADAARRNKSVAGQERSVVQGATFGFGDELDAGAAALETGAHNLFTRATGGTPKYGMSDAYGAVMDSNKGELNAFARAHPVQDVGLQIAGGFVGPGAAAGARYIGGARSLVGATARSAAVGAGLGAVAGAGSADGGLAERGVGAAKGAVTGAVIGGAAPSVARIAQTTARGVNAALGQPFGGAARGAAARLQEAMQQDGLTPQQVAAAVRQWQSSGVTPEFLNVVGENTRALIRAAGSQEGGARTAAQNYRNTTVASIPNRAIDRTNALTPGDTQTPATFADNMRTQRRVDANVRYAGPNATPVAINPQMEEALRGPTGRAAIAEARRVAEINGDHAVMSELDQLPGGDLSSFPQMTGRTLEAVRRTFRDMGRAEATHGPTEASRGYGNRVTLMDSGLDQVPGLTEARAHYRGQSQAIDAAEGGPSVLGPTSEFQPAHAGLNPDATRGAQIRERQNLRDKFGTRDNAIGLLRDIAQAPDVRPNLFQLYGERGNNYADAAGNLISKQEHANFIAPNTGSQTQSKTQDVKNIFSAGKAAMEVLGGSLRPIVERLAHGLTMTERERELLVQYGIGSPDDALRALAAAPNAGRITGNAFRRATVAATPAAASQTARN